MTTRRFAAAGIAATTASLLSSCGTIIYPDRAYQKSRGTLDPAVVILDAVGLFFFIIPGLVAFAVDFGTGAIYFPAGHEPGDKERTIFDQADVGIKPSQQDIEQVVSSRVGIGINLDTPGVKSRQLASLSEFDRAYSELLA